MYVVIFRSRLREESRDEYAAWGREIGELAAHQPGYISDKTFTAADGERVTIAEFDSEESIRAWQQQPRHREAQQKGRETFYSQYHLQVCPVERAYGWERDNGEPVSGEVEAT